MGMNVNPDSRKEMITRKARELYEKRGGVPGHELDDWLEAERIVERELQLEDPERIAENTAMVLVWDPEVISEEDYRELVLVLGDLVRSHGGLGVKRIKSIMLGAPIGQEVPA